MTERDTVLTDFLLAAVAAGLAVLSAQTPHGHPPAALFAALAVAALLGGIWHGWFSGQSRGGLGGALWLATLLAIGVADTALWLMASELFPSLRGFVQTLALGQFGLFAMIVIFLTRKFWLASAFSLPPTLVLLAGLQIHAIWTGVAALLVALAGAGLQAAKIGLPRFGLGHNALYHLVQIGALILLALSLPAISDFLTEG